MKGHSKRKGKKLLPILLILAVLLSGNGTTVFAEAVSGNGIAMEGNVETGLNEETVYPDSSDVLQKEAAILEVAVSASLSENGPANPVHHCTKDDSGNTDTTDWNYVYFGSYPQSEVTDEETIKTIEEAMRVSGNSADVGTDVWINGTKYRRISKIDTNFDEYFDDVSNNGYRYFKWERIKWKVLNNDGNTLFVVADRAVDCKDYNGEYTDTTWETSIIRNWLNNSFYNTAFSSSEQGAIVMQNVVNEDNPEYGTEGGNNTSDNIYLLSISEVTNAAYGFCSDASTVSMSRRMKTSDYANARGARRSSSSGYEGNCRWWWLRSPGGTSRDAASVDGGGWVRRYGDSVNDDFDGVCPALHINLSSGIWSMTDDGTSGEGGNGGGNNEEKILTDLQASKTKSEYEQGEQLNLNDLTVTAVYKNSDKKVLEEGSYTIDATGIDMNKPGTYMLGLSYTENGVTKTTAITITVKAKDGGNTQNPGGDTPQPVKDTPQSGGNTQNQPVKVTKLTITAPSKKLAAGKKVKLTLKAEPENALDKTVTWKTSNAKYATVDKNGEVSLKAAGAGKTVTITATANDGSGKKAIVKLKIMKHAVKSIKLKASGKTLKAGKSMTVKATIKTTGSSANKTLKWISSNTKYATVSKSGKVTAKKAGKGKTVTITASSTDGSGKKAAVKIKIK